MIYILNKDLFKNKLEEAKIGEYLHDSQKTKVSEIWGEKYLEYEEVLPTDKIEHGKWKLSQEDRDIIVDKFFNTDSGWIREKFDSLSDRFFKTLKSSIEIKKDNLTNTDYHNFINSYKSKFNPKRPTFKQLASFFKNIFKLINSNETKSNEMILRDDNGRPILDDNNRPKKVSKEKGSVVYNSNYGNINSFIQSYNRAFIDDKIDEYLFTHANMQNLYSIYEDNSKIGEFDIFGDDNPVYLLISHDPSDILNMSVSKYYSSCQELYFGGGHGIQYMKGLLINVFDPNTSPAFLVFDTPYYLELNGKETKVSDNMPLCRTLIRSMEPFDSDDDWLGLYFDKTYPERMEELLVDMIEKYTNNLKNNLKIRRSGRYYKFMPDIDEYDMYRNGGNLKDPYMDNLDTRSVKVIGSNTKSISFNILYDWSQYKILPGSKLKEIIIETPEIPYNFFDLDIEIDWIKFKYINFKDIKKFKNIITDSIAFDKCKIDINFWKDLTLTFKNLKKLSISGLSTRRRKSPDEFSKLKNIEELELIFTFDELNNNILSMPNLKKLTLSGDMVSNKKNKEIILKLKNKGVDILYKGVVL